MRGRRSRVPFLFIFVIASVLLFARIIFEGDEDTSDRSHVPPGHVAHQVAEVPKSPEAMNVPTRPDQAAKPDSLIIKSKDSPDQAPVREDKKGPKKGYKPSEDPLSCYGLCPPETGMDQGEYVDKVIKERASKYKLPNKTGPALASAMHKPRRRQWIITEATVFGKGTQPKLVFQLKMTNGVTRSAVFKPKLGSRYEPATPCGGFDRYNAELGAYYLRRTLNNFVKTTRVIGVKLDLKEDLWPIRNRDERLRNNTWLTDDGQYCVRFECEYCHELIACGDGEHKSVITGSMSFWALNQLKQVLNPWSGTCTQKGTETWRKNPALCAPGWLFREKFFSNQRVLLDVIDAAIFDYLADNPDRHTFEYWENGTDKVFVLLDNGKAFPDVNHNDASILAALFQCCRVRRSTYDSLRQYSDPAVLKSAFISWMATDPVYPFLDDGHIAGVSRRIRRTLALIELCMDKYGASAVILEPSSGYDIF